MNSNDIKLKKTAQFVGIALLAFLLLFQGVYSTFVLNIAPIITEILGQAPGYVIVQILSGIIYAATFILPALLFSHLNRKEKTENSALSTPQLSPKLAPYIIMATVAIAISCAYVNSWLGTAFGITGNLESANTFISPLDFVLLIFTTAIVPAISEEFLFRKTLIPALRPYGEGFAIFSSAIFFGLMHQNILQIFYTTMAGVLLGYIYVKTRSYLCVFLIHFVNNFVSILQKVFVSNLDEAYSTIAIITLTAIIVSLGTISAIILIFKEKTKEDVYASGSFGKIIRPSLGFASRQTSIAPTKALFLSPSVLIFIILTASTCLLQFFL